jgi:hypothetical protein
MERAEGERAAALARRKPGRRQKDRCDDLLPRVGGSEIEQLGIGCRRMTAHYLDHSPSDVLIGV